MTDHFNQLTPEEDEALAHFIEECAEAIVAVTKIMRHGLQSFNPDDRGMGTNRQALEREVGDILGAIEILQQVKLVFPSGLERAKQHKLEQVKKWFHHVVLP